MNKNTTHVSPQKPLATSPERLLTQLHCGFEFDSITFRNVKYSILIEYNLRYVVIKSKVIFESTGTITHVQ